MSVRCWHHANAMMAVDRCMLRHAWRGLHHYRPVPWTAFMHAIQSPPPSVDYGCISRLPASPQRPANNGSDSSELETPYVPSLGVASALKTCLAACGQQKNEEVGKVGPPLASDRRAAHPCARIMRCVPLLHRCYPPLHRCCRR